MPRWTRRARSESTRRASRGGTQRRLTILVSIFQETNNTRTEDRSQDSRWLHIFSHLCLSMLLYRALTYFISAPPSPTQASPTSHRSAAHSRRCYAFDLCRVNLHLTPAPHVASPSAAYQICHRVTDWKSDSGAKEPHMASRIHSSHCLPWRLRLWKM